MGENKKKVVKVGSEVVLELVYPGYREKLIATITKKKKKGGTILVDSPLAKCILGKEVGFTGEYMVVSKITVKILEIH